MKHFIGYSNPTSGNDRSDSVVSDWELLNYYAPPFLAAVRDGHVRSAMETYASLNGHPVVSSHVLLTDLLRHDMGFDGVLVTDENEIHRLIQEHHVAATEKEALWQVFNRTSVDMNMVAKKYSANSFLAAMVHVNSSNASRSISHRGAAGEEVMASRFTISIDRIDASVRRILQLKYDLGLLQSLPTSTVETTTTIQEMENAVRHAVGSYDDQAMAKALADESIILLQNNLMEPVDAVHPRRVLPIEDPFASILLTGPLAHNKALLCGGWTIYWQGSTDSSLIPHGQTIREAMEGHFTSMRYEPDQDASILHAHNYTYTIVVVGETTPYAEKNGDLDDLTLPSDQLAWIHALHAIPTTHVIVIVIAGRPRLLPRVAQYAKGVLVSFLPCAHGGNAIADIIRGAVNPSGKLPLTYPSSSGHVHLPYFHRVNSKCLEAFTECPVEWPFGSGLSYTTFTYRNMTLERDDVTHDETRKQDKADDAPNSFIGQEPLLKVAKNGTLTVGVTVMNTGTRAGQEVVMLFLSQMTRRAAVPETKLLKRFEKIALVPGEAIRVTFRLTPSDWSFYEPRIGRGFHPVAETGASFRVALKPETDCRELDVIEGTKEKTGEMRGHSTNLCRAFYLE
jgi:beta-glucosidase